VLTPQEFPEPHYYQSVLEMKYPNSPKALRKPSILTHPEIPLYFSLLWPIAIKKKKGGGNWGISMPTTPYI
jgi:hypothetical protein